VRADRAMKGGVVVGENHADRRQKKNPTAR